MSIALATKGIISVSVSKEASPPDPSSMNGIITRGFGEFGGATVVEYSVVSVCEPDVTSHEYGTKYMGGKELKPKIKTKRIVRYEKNIWNRGD